MTLSDIDDLTYDRRSIATDYFRSLMGIAACGLPLAFADPMPWLAWALSIVLILFLGFAMRGIFRQFCRFRLDETGFERLYPRPKRVNWSDLSGMKLRYYSTRRIKEQSMEGGWFQLQLIGNKEKIIIDSNLSGYDQVLKASARAAGERGLALDPVTRANLSAIGVALHSPGGRPGQ